MGGCTAAHYRKSADKEAYGIIREKETNVLGRATGFTIDTPYSKRDPNEIKAPELIADRNRTNSLFLTIQDALRIAVTNNRTYQTRKETLYRSALDLSDSLHDYAPQIAASSVATVFNKVDTDTHGLGQSVRSRLSVGQLLRTGARLSATVANDIFRYYTGDPSRTVMSIFTVDIVQPLLRDPKFDLIAESLTQSERDVIYAVRTYSRFQTTFAVDNVVIPYLRLLQQKDAVRNEYNSYRNAISSRELSEALGFDGRISRVQVDQARQRELDSRDRYFLAVERYRDLSDSFKSTLSLPLAVSLQVDDRALEELNAIGLPSVDVGEIDGYAIAVEKRLDLLNQIDGFEDRKRRIKVYAKQLKADLNFFAQASLESRGNTDYTRFNLKDYRGHAGVELKLPLDRLLERNDYRRRLIDFEVQLRGLAQALDDVREEVRQGIRGLELNRKIYEVQSNSVTLANQRVEGADMLFQAGRVQIRDLLDAQDAQLRARNALTAAVVDYHAVRLGLLSDLGVLDVADEKFWLKSYELPQGRERRAAPPADKPAEELITPEKLFGNK